VSPPEKRLTLDATNEDIQKIVQRCLEALANEKNVNQLDLSILVANIIENKSLISSEIIQQIINEQIRQKNTANNNTAASIISNSSPSQTTTSTPTTKLPVSSSAKTCQITSSLLHTVQQLSHLSLKQEAIESMKTNQLFEYYQDLQRLVVSSSSGDEHQHHPACATHNSTAVSRSSSTSTSPAVVTENNRLSPANSKYYLTKNHQNSNSFECGYTSHRSPIYRSNSSPSYSSTYGEASAADRNGQVACVDGAVQSERRNGAAASVGGSAMAKPLPEIVITESRTEGYLNEYGSGGGGQKQLKADNLENGTLNKAMFFAGIPNFATQPINFGEMLGVSQKSWLLNLNENSSLSSQPFGQIGHQNSLQHQQNLCSSAVKTSKLLKPHVCDSCQKRFAR